MSEGGWSTFTNKSRFTYNPTPHLVGHTKSPNPNPSRVSYKVTSAPPTTTTTSTAPTSTTTAVGSIKKSKDKWKQEQVDLEKKLIIRDDFDVNNIKYIGGVDISFNMKNASDKNDAVASLVILSWPDLKVVHELYHRVSMNLPYIPGFLAFREVPHLEKIIDEVRANKPDLVPDVILVDGNGTMHMRGFGQACHLGVVKNIPTIGVAKKVLFVDGMVDADVQSWTKSLKHVGDTCNMTGRTGVVRGVMMKSSLKEDPIYISPGHRISMQTSVNLVKQCLRSDRIPEPIKQADLRSRAAIRQINRRENRK